MEKEVTLIRSRMLPLKKGLRLLRAASRIFLIIVVFLILIEIVLQIGCRLTRGSWYPAIRLREFPPLYCHDSKLGWRVRPCLDIIFETGEFSTRIMTDESGYRKLEKADNKHPVLVIGNSFAFGWGVEAADSFVAQLSKKTGMTFYSRGVPGYGLEQEEVLLKELFAVENPSLIILEVRPLDWDILNTDLMTETNHYLISKKTLERYPRWLVHFRIALFNSSSLFGFFEKIGRIVSIIGPREPFGGYGLNAFMAGEQPEIINQARNRAFSSIVNMKKEADSRRIPLVIVVVPSVFQIFPEELNSWIKVYGISGKVDLERPDRELREFAIREDIPIIELYPPFKDYIKKGGDRLYYRVDPHWNAKGHTVAANFIKEFLIEKKIIKDNK